MYGADTFAGGDNANNREKSFKITSTKFYVPIVTLSTKDIVNSTKQLNEGFKRFSLDAFFKELIDFLLLLLMLIIMMLIEFKETVIENIFFQG